MFVSNNPPDLEQAGFTLIELAVVLAVVSLLISGVLKAQTLIESAQMQRMIQNMQGIKMAHYAYFDRSGEYPGDTWPSNHARLSITHSNGNGAGNFFQTLAEAHFIGSEQPEIEPSIAQFYSAGYGSTQNVDTHKTMQIENKNQICARHLKSRAFARMLDQKLDDGNPDEGQVQASMDSYQGDASLDEDARVCLEL